MDSPHFMQLCFLLLTVAAPHPNIAMPSDNCAKGTQDSCSSKTNVTIYHCKDCYSDICKLSDYEGFEKIVETQNNVFSNEKIQLVTSKTRISVCFQQDPKGVYAIVWEKDNGTGDSCGILDSGAFSENVNGSFTGICCETETNLSVSNHPLKCHIKRPGERDRKSTADITTERMLGDPQNSFGGKSSIVIIIVVVVIGVCAAVLALRICHVRQNRNHQSPV